jgi:two-component system, cell cycle sensor histidine kinase and response regulator CckA
MIVETISAGPFLPHGFCYQWKAALIWLHVVSDILIAIAYLAIPVALIYFTKKRRDLPFRWMFLCFGIFITACGATHVMEVVTLWVPAYWTSGAIKVVTALASLPTAILVVRILPEALNLASGEQMRAANVELAKQAAALKESEDLYRDLVENSQDLICTHDFQGILLSVNQTPLKILGYSRDELLNKPLRDFVVPEARTRCDEYLAEIKRDGFAKGLLPVLTKNGQVRVWEYNNTVRTDGVGAPIVRGIAHDVTEQKRAEKALRKTEERFRLMAENIKEIFWIIEPKTLNLIYASPAYEQIWERPREEIESEPTAYLNSIHPEDTPRILEKFGRLEAENHLEDEYRIVCPGGRVKWVLSRAFTARDSSGSLATFVGTTQDITAHRDSEQALRQAQKMEAVGLLASGVAHDFNNILAGILGYGELVLKSLNVNDPRSSRLQSIVGAALQGRNLTGKLLAFSCDEVFATYPVNVDTEILQMEDMLRRLIDENIDLAFKYGCKERVLLGSGLVYQIILNLAINAKDAMPKGGRLCISTALAEITSHQAEFAGIPPGRYLRLEVSDTGCGMNSEVQQRIFEPFFTTKLSGRGTGLGLFTVFSIVRQCSGYIRVHSKPGEGATFDIYLPIVESDAPDYQEAPKTAPRSSAKNLIMVVEDNPRVRNALQDQLKDLGYSVLSEKTATQAVDDIRRVGKQLDLVVTDVVMPGLNGPDLVQKLRQVQPNLRVLYITGYANQHILSKDALGAGTDLLHKPFTQRELGLKVHSLLDRR